MDNKKRTLEIAVSECPTIALRKLIQRLGVNYKRIKQRIREWDYEQIKKRLELDLEKRTAEKRKQRRQLLGRASPPLRLPIKDLIGGSPSVKKSKSKSTPESTKLMWRAGSSEGTHPRFHDVAVLKTDSPDHKSTSKGLTVPFTKEETEKLMHELE